MAELAPMPRLRERRDGGDERRATERPEGELEVAHEFEFPRVKGFSGRAARRIKKLLENCLPRFNRRPQALVPVAKQSPWRDAIPG
jgi:hypothetical protein